LESRDKIQESFAQLTRQGSEPALPGPDGRSPLDILRATQGCESIVSLLESIELSKAAKAAPPSASTATRL
jgi:hypothetical protein